ncbi:MAG: glycosyltransferase family 2 protein [Candidatus Nanosalina sp.]
MGLDRVTIGINAFMRPLKLEKALESIEALEETPFQVIVADDSFDKSLNREVCREFRKSLDLKYLDLEKDSGASASRNRIVEETSTEYLLLLDDDQYLSGEIKELEKILRKNQNLGGVAPSWIEDGKRIVDARDIRVKDGWVVLDTFEDKEEKEACGTTYFIYDFIATSALYRTSALEELGWDENFTIGGEHLDFFLEYKRNSDWRFAITEDVSVVHDPGPGQEGYMDERRNREKLRSSRSYFRKKWGVKGFLFRERHGQEYEFFMSELLANIFYTLPNRVHWKLKEKDSFEKFKKAWTKLTDENFR